MDEKRKPSIVVWIVAVLLLVLVLYPASIWPALWINRARPANEPMLTAYMPVVWVVRHLPRRGQEFFGWYVMSAVGGKRNLFLGKSEMRFVE